MKNILIVTVFAFTSLLGTSITHATVGGPTIIDSLQYSTNNRTEMIYEVQSYGGKGCLPEVYSLNIITGISKPLLTCRDADMMIDGNVYNAKLESVLAQFPSLLKHINLSQNKFSANVTVVEERKLNQQTGDFGGVKFRLDLSQNGSKIYSTEYSGCQADQPQIIEGYTIPYTNSLLILVSTKGDCFEGGYTSERLYAIPNVTLYDISPLPLKKGQEAMAGPGNLSITSTRSAVTSSPTTITNDVVPTVSPVQSIPNDQQTRTNGYLNLEIIIGALILIIIVLILKK